MTNSYDKIYEIRLARRADIPVIMNFIKEHWAVDHVLACSREVFEYEFCSDDEQVNFVLAYHRRNRSLEGICGFKPCSHPDKHSKLPLDVWGCAWIVNYHHHNEPLLGVELAKRLFVLTGCRYHIGTKADPKTTVVLRRLFFGDQVAMMKQYYLLNPTLTPADFKLARIASLPSLESADTAPQVQAVGPYGDFAALKADFCLSAYPTVPLKDEWYVERRYFHCPWYRYQVFGLRRPGEQVRAVIVARLVVCNGVRVLRIVDYLGDHTLLDGLKAVLTGWLMQYNCEYLDLYERGLDDELLTKAGLTLRKVDDENIIPNYLEPYICKNVDVWVHFQDPRTLFFKADGDQDRPSCLPVPHKEE